MRLLLILVLSGLLLEANAQLVTIKKVELSGDKILVLYDLEDSNPEREFSLNLFASKDNFAAPLQKVKGDIGSEIKPGANKRVEWRIREEYGGYKGRLALEIRGKVYMPFLRLQNFNTEQSYKRGKQYNVQWKPGNTNPILIELFKGDQRIAGDANLPNNGTYTLNIPSQSKTGSDYRLKITDSKNSDEVIYTEYFKVKPKVPLLLKVLPILAVGGVAAVLAGGGEKPSKDTSEAIELPPVPGN